MFLRLLLPSKRCLSSSGRQAARIIDIPQPTQVHAFGASHKATPILRDLQWTVKQGECWVIVGSAGRPKVLFEALMGHHRITPLPHGGLFPFLGPSVPDGSVSFVSFARRQLSVSSTGFTDYTARYGAIRDEDRVTLRQSLADTSYNLSAEEFDDLANQLDLSTLLDLPSVALSNGQTRRARIFKALATRPRLLLLEEPFTGLDVQRRPSLARLLYNVQERGETHILMSLRLHDPLPEWITDVAFVDNATVKNLSRSQFDSVRPKQEVVTSQKSSDATPTGYVDEMKEIVGIRDLNVQYGSRKVLHNLDWTIRQGERYHLQGANGSGKTTLLSVITGDHPQSYIQPHLFLFSKPRKKLATADLQRNIGHASPEIFQAFPRSVSLTVRDVIATGFESTFAYRPRSPAQDGKIDHLLQQLGPASWGSPESNEAFSTKPFVSLTPGGQAMVLLLRALVGKPTLLILDEVFSGMDDGMIQAAKEYLRQHLDPHQAVIFVSHWEEELPWSPGTYKTKKLP